MGAIDQRAVAAIERVTLEALNAWRPPKRLTLSEWADKEAFLSAESSAKEGRWRTLPYQRELMDSMTDPTVEEIVFMKSARVGFTKCLNNLIGYHIHQDPCSIMLVQPTESDAEGYSKEEIAPMLRDTPALAGLVADAKSRDANNTTLNKSFPGGVLSMVGANSPRGFRRVSRRIVLFDEVDGYPLSAGKEGDPIKLGKRRSEYFWNRKVVLGSTPTVKGVSRIEKAFDETDKRRYFVPCPHCGEMQYLKWSNIKWPKGNPLAAYYACEANGCVIEHSQKYEMIEKGEWRATAVAKRPGLRGYHIWAAYSYSPNATWGQLAMEWVEAQGDPELLKTFVNTALGETWEESYTAKLDSDTLAKRAEAYELLTAPAGVSVITCGIDVQPNRWEIQTVGWGDGEEAWVLNYAVVYGDPSRFEGWSQVLDVINTPIRHASGVDMLPYAAIVDSGDGNLVNEVYAFARTHRDRHILAGKGMTGGARPPIGAPTKQDINIRGQKIKHGVMLYGIGVDGIKSTIYSRLKREDTEGGGIIHFPLGLETEYYKQLTAEKQIVKMTNGFPKLVWWKKDGDRNEALDTMVYAYAALHYCYSRHNRATFWKQMASKLAKALPEPVKSAVKEGEPAQAPVVVTHHNSGKVSLAGWRRGQ